MGFVVHNAYYKHAQSEHAEGMFLIAINMF